MELKSPIPPAVDDRSIVIDGRELEHQGGVNLKLDRDLPNLVITPVGVMESVQDTWNHGLSYAQQALSTTPCGPCYQLVPCEEAEAESSFVFSLFQWDLTHHYKKVPFQTREQVEESLALMNEDDKLALAKRYGCRPNQLASYIPSNGRGRRPVLRELHFLTYSPLDDCEPEYLDSVYSAFLAALAGTATEEQKTLFRECRDGLVDSGLSVSDAIELFREIPRLTATIRASQEVLGVRFGRDEYDEHSDALEGFVEKPLEVVDVADEGEQQVITEKMATGIPPQLQKHLKSNATWWKFVNQGANLVAEDEDALKKGIFGVVNIKFLNAYAQADGVGQFFAPFISGPEWKIPTFRQIKAALERLVQASEQAHGALLQDSEWSRRSISMTALYNEGQVDSEEVDEVEVFDDDLDEDGNPYPLNFEPDEAEVPDMYFDEAEQMTSVRPRPGLGSRVPDSPQMLPQEELLAREIARKAAPRDILVPRSAFGPFAQELPWEQDQNGFFKGHPLARQIQKFIDGVNSPRSYASIGVNDPSVASYVGVVRVSRNVEIFTELAPVPPCEFWAEAPRSAEPRFVEFFYVNIVYGSGTLEEVLAPLGFFNDFPTEVEIYIGKHAAAPTAPQQTVLANDALRDVWVKDVGGMRFWRNVHFPKRSVLRADKMYIIERMYSDEDTQTFRCSKFYNDDNSVPVHAFRVNQKGSEVNVWSEGMIPTICEDGSFQTQPFLGVNQRESKVVKFPISVETFELMTAWYAQQDLPCPYLMPMPSLNGGITLYDAIFTCRAEIDMWTLLSKPVLVFVEGKIEKVQAHQAFPTLILAVGELLRGYMDPRNPLDDADLFDHIHEIYNGLMEFQRRAVYHSMFNLNEGSIQPFSMRLRELMMGDSSFQRSKEFGNGKTAYQELVKLDEDSVLRGILNAIGGAIYNSGASARDFFLALGYSHYEFGLEEMAEKCIAHLKDQTFRQYQPWGTKKQGTYSLGVLGDVVAYYTAWLYLSDVSRNHLELLVDVTGGEEGFAWDLPLAFKVSAKLKHGPILGRLISRSFHRKVMQGSGSGWEIPDVLQERLPPLLLAHGKDVNEWPAEQVYRRSVEEAQAINQGLIEARRVLEKRIRRAVYERGLGFAGRQMLGAILDVPPQNLNKEFLREKLERDRDLGVLSVGEFRLLKVYAE